MFRTSGQVHKRPIMLVARRVLNYMSLFRTCVFEISRSVSIPKPVSWYHCDTNKRVGCMDIFGRWCLLRSYSPHFQFNLGGKKLSS